MPSLNRTALTVRSPKLRRALARLAIGTALLPGAGLGAMALAPTASANSSGCATLDNVCISVTGDAGHTVTVTGYGEYTDFYGTIQVNGPNGYSDSSPDQDMYVTPDGGYTFTIPNAATGNYCVSGYDANGNYEGAACETVS